MRKRIFQAGAALVLGLGGLTAALFFGSEKPPEELAGVGPAPAQVAIKLSDRALELHADISAEVAARVAADGDRESPPDPDNRPDWLQNVIDRGYVDERYADLMLRDDYEEVVQERFHVLKSKTGVREADGCDHSPTTDGAPVCWNEWGYHPYLTYELPTLREMASYDPVAAEALSLRVSDGEASLYYAVRAAQLAGKPGPIVRYLGMHPSSSSRDPKGDQLLQRYLLALVIDEMGYPYRYSKEIGYWLEDAGVEPATIHAALTAGLVLAEPKQVLK